jgi:hypothetical protein
MVYKKYPVWCRDRMVVGFTTTSAISAISAISWRSVLLVEETGEPGENHRHVASHWQTLSHNVVSNTPTWIFLKVVLNTIALTHPVWMNRLVKVNYASYWIYSM